MSDPQEENKRRATTPFPVQEEGVGKTSPSSRDGGVAIRLGQKKTPPKPDTVEGKQSTPPSTKKREGENQTAAPKREGSGVAIQLGKKQPLKQADEAHEIKPVTPLTTVDKPQSEPIEEGQRAIAEKKPTPIPTPVDKEKKKGGGLTISSNIRKKENKEEKPSQKTAQKIPDKTESTPTKPRPEQRMPTGKRKAAEDARARREAQQQALTQQVDPSNPSKPSSVVDGKRQQTVGSPEAERDPENSLPIPPVVHEKDPPRVPESLKDQSQATPNQPTSPLVATPPQPRDNLSEPQKKEGIPPPVVPSQPQEKPPVTDKKGDIPPPAAPSQPHEKPPVTDKKGDISPNTSSDKPANTEKKTTDQTPKGEKPQVLTATGEPETLLALLEPDPEEVTKLKQGQKQDRFLSQSVVLEESGLSALIRSTILLITMVISVFLIWSSFSKVDEMAATTGKVIPNSPTQIVQHFEGGIVEHIAVKEGQIIEKGGLLIRLNAEAALGELHQMQSKLASIRVQKERLNALVEQREPDFSSVPPEYNDLVQGQLKLYNAQITSFRSQEEVFQTRIDRAEFRLENLLDQQDALQKQIAFVEQEMQVKQQGYEKGLMSRLMVISTHRDQQRVESELVRVVGDLMGARQDLSEATRALNQLIDSAREEYLKELGVLTADNSQISKGMDRLMDRVSRLNIVSPVWGIIKILQIKTVGGVIAPGSMIAEIIPLDETRWVETKISTKDIGHVKVGQAVTVKVSTYDFARYGGISGILESISPSTFEDPAGKEAYYQGKVRLEKSHMGGDPTKNQILPGMTVQADIHTGAKTVMEYMLKPIYSSVNKAFRER